MANGRSSLSSLTRTRPGSHLVASVLATLALVAGCNSDDGGRSAAPAPPAAAAEPAAPVTVSVQADAPVPTRGSMNGFIHSLDPSQPPEAMVAPLEPRLWRSDLLRAPVDRARAFGAEYVLVVSDLWGYPATGWAGRGPPWADLGKWERFVRRLAREHADLPVTWDIWNEPNSPTFWEGGQKRFFEVYAVASRVLGEELGPDAVIGGPSTSRYSPRWFAAFLDSCLAASCEIDFLAWHENLRPEDQLGSISEHLTDARARFLDNPRFAALGVQRIHVNEYVGVEDRYLAGETVAYLDQLERGGADRAARSCWTEEECSPPSLDGLLAPDGSPRGTWWVHNWYAAGLASRVRGESSDPALAVLASSEAPGQAQVLLGQVSPRPAPEPAPRALTPVKLEVAGLPPGSRPVVRVERVPAAGQAAVPQPEVLDEREVTSANGRAELDLPPIGPHEAMLVIVRPR